MTGNQLKDILDGINVSLLRLNDRIDKLEAAKPEDKRQPLGDGDYVLDEGAGWFDVGPFTIRVSLQTEDMHVIVYDRKDAEAQEYCTDACELRHIVVLAEECK